MDERRGELRLLNINTEPATPSVPNSNPFRSQLKPGLPFLTQLPPPSTYRSYSTTFSMKHAGPAGFKNLCTRSVVVAALSFNRKAFHVSPFLPQAALLNFPFAPKGKTRDLFSISELFAFSGVLFPSGAPTFVLRRKGLRKNR